MKKGMVYLIGAGPGDTDLITVRALRALASADCIVYDFLSNAEIIQKFDCEKIYVGKTGSDHTLPQDKINELIIRKAHEGKTVARLKGGDPFIFGRGGEEAQDLVNEGIPFRIIPGISSFYAAPAYAGIPVTHRDHADSFEVITGHRRNDSGDDLEITLPEYNPHRTFVFLMGMKNLSRIAENMIHEKGFPAETPAAVISWGTTPRQKTALGTLMDIAGKAESEGVGAPAIIIIGGVVTLREDIRWFDTLPLFGKKIVVTRTREQASQLSQKLYDLGAQVIEFPTIHISPKKDMTVLIKELENIRRYDWIIFTSQNAVEIFFTQMKASGMDTRSLSNGKIAAIGPATAQELERHGIAPDLVPEEYVAEALISCLGKSGISGKRVLLPCASEARYTLAEGLEKLGAAVSRIHIYDTVLPDKIDTSVIEELRTADIVTFTSSSTARNFFSIVGSIKGACACIGPVTAEAVRDAGFEPAVSAVEYTIQGLVDAIVEHFGSQLSEP